MKKRTLIVPANADAVKLEHWADFRIAEDKFFESQELDDLIEAVKVFYQDSYLEDLPVGSWNDTKLNIQKPTFLGLYLYINNLVTKYEPKALKVPFSVKYKNKDFTLTIGDTTLLMGVRPITVLEAVTLLELQRKCGESYEEIFNLKLEHLAILLRPEGEKLPLSLRDRETYITKRKMFWKDAPMSLAIDLQNYFNILLEGILKRFPSDSGVKSKEAIQHWEEHGWNSLLASLPVKMQVSYKEAIDTSFEDALFFASHSQI